MRFSECLPNITGSVCESWITDKAYGRTPHFRPHHTEAERRMMPPAARIVAEEFDRIHRTAHLAVEDSFAEQVTKFPHADRCRSHKITQGGHLIGII